MAIVKTHLSEINLATESFQLGYRLAYQIAIAFMVNPTMSHWPNVDQGRSQRAIEENFYTGTL